MAVFISTGPDLSSVVFKSLKLKFAVPDSVKPVKHDMEISK